MNCLSCNKKLRAKYVDYDYSEKSGIPGTILSDVKEYKCKPCKETYYDLGSVDEINHMIGDILLNADELNRSHVRFIRKEIFGMNYMEFGRLIETSGSNIRDIETYRKPMSESLSDSIKFQLLKKMKMPRFVMEN